MTVLTAEAPTLVIVPTYNERENVERLCEGILALKLPVQILFVDDNSPDGTGLIIDALAERCPQVFALHRPAKLGIGSAHCDALKWARQRGYRRVITMDCDFTHPPQYVRELLEISRQDPADIVVGSRYMQSNSLPGWNLFRRFLTKTGHLLTTYLLDIPYDATGALRLYRLDRIPQLVFDLVSSKGYSFFFESLYAIHRNGFSVREFSIALPARTYGNSKMAFGEICRSVKLLGSLFFTRILNPLRYSISDTRSIEAAVRDTNRDAADWNSYWQEKRRVGGWLYDRIATVYRRVLIRPSLTRFVQRYFPEGSLVLHTGSGSGMVDADIADYVRIRAMDISENALKLYQEENPKHAGVMWGSVLDIPLPPEAVDGIYNLGLMEHFTTREIVQILTQFERVLKPQGRLIMFWPPEFGLSVLFFKTLKWFCTNILRRPDIEFHPEEITRVRSREQVVCFLEAAGFELEEYYFGIRDLCTYVMIAAKKKAPLAISEQAVVNQ